MKRRRVNASVMLGDFLFILLMVVLTLVNPPSQDEAIAAPGNMIVSIAWKPGPDDVDLWVRGPDGVAVGYKRKSSELFNLLRDDLGTVNDKMPLNYENAYSRGLPDGEYIVNLHCYSCSTPHEVAVEIRMGRGEPKLVFKENVELAPRQERTVVRFYVRDGSTVAGSRSDIFEPLRNGRTDNQ